MDKNNCFVCKKILNKVISFESKKFCSDKCVKKFNDCKKKKVCEFC
ncbi:MAG: hypothetical protein AABX19_02495 [Nanoarchaeota archaeon]